MKQGLLRGVTSLGILLAIASCADLTVAPGQQKSGQASDGSNGSGSTVPGSPTEPVAPAVASIVVSPTTVEINAPYSYGGYQSETQAGPSQQEVAGYPTTAQILVSHLAESGDPTKPAELIWTSSNPALVVVDGNGWIRSVDPGVSGTAVITAQLKNNPKVAATTTVTVRNDGKLAIELQ